MNDFPDKKFVFLCLNCQKNNELGAVNHHYVPLFDKKGSYTGLKIEYRCLTCGEEEKKELLVEESPGKPKNKWEHLKMTHGKVLYFGDSDEEDLN